jgi:hypothetical protein
LPVHNDSEFIEALATIEDPAMRAVFIYLTARVADLEDSRAMWLGGFGFLHRLQPWLMPFVMLAIGIVLGLQK